MKYAGQGVVLRHKMCKGGDKMILSDLLPGEYAVLLGAPNLLLPTALGAGKKVQLVMKRPELSLVLADGIRFALSGSLAEQLVVVRAP
jgi:hypothetical protein